MIIILTCSCISRTPQRVVKFMEKALRYLFAPVFIKNIFKVKEESKFLEKKHLIALKKVTDIGCVVGLKIKVELLVIFCWKVNFLDKCI